MPASASPPSLRNLILTVYAKLVWSSTIWSRPCCKHGRIYWTSCCKQRIKLLFIIVGHDSKVILPDVEWLEQRCPVNSSTGSREDRKWKGTHSWVIQELFLTHVRSDRFTIPNKGNNCHHYSRAHLRKIWHLDSLWKRDLGELGNGLFSRKILTRTTSLDSPVAHWRPKVTGLWLPWGSRVVIVFFCFVNNHVSMMMIMVQSMAAIPSSTDLVPLAGS